MAVYMPFAGAADTVMDTCLREFAESKAVTFPLAFAILMAMDCSLVTRRYDAGPLENVNELCDSIMTVIFGNKLYTDDRG